MQAFERRTPSHVTENKRDNPARAQFAIQPVMGRKKWDSDKSTAKIDELKLLLCYKVKTAARRRHLNQTQMSIYMRTSRACASQVDNLKIDQLTVNQLFTYLARTNLPAAGREGDHKNPNGSG